MAPASPHSASPRVLALLGNAQLFGQERDAIECVRLARAGGADVLVVTNARWGAHAIEPYLDRLGLPHEPLRYARHFTHALPKAAWPGNLAAIATGSARLLALARAFRPTHLLAGNPHYVLAVLPALAALRVPLVYRLGDVPTTHHALYRQLWQRAILPRTARFVCISGYIRDQVIALGARPEQATVLPTPAPARPPSVGPGGLPPDLRAEADGTAPRAARRTVVALGEVGAHKGTDVLVEAVSDLTRGGLPVRLLVAGQYKGGDAAWAERLQRLVAESPADVRLLGYVEDVPALMRLADVHAAPSVGVEAAGLVTVEAKRAGVPSVVFPSGGMPEFIRESGRDGIVCHARTSEALADGLRSLLALGDADLRTHGEAARASVEPLGLTEAQAVSGWRTIYDETARARGRRVAA